MAPFALKVLGNCTIYSDNGTLVQSVLAQPRRFALLVYLALEGRSAAISRERIIGVFWPNAPPDRGRGALNQAVFYLRRSLGPEAIRTQEPDELEIDRNVVKTDAVEFLDAIEKKDWRRAASLYTGELLPGFHVDGGTDFENWLTNTRASLRRHACEAAWHLSAEAKANGDVHEAAIWARRAAEWSEGDEVMIRHVLAALDRLNDRAGVLEVYETLRRSLAVFGAEPAPETRGLLEQIRARWVEDDRQANGNAETPVTREKTESSKPTPKANVSTEAGPTLARGGYLRRYGMAAAIVSIGTIVTASSMLFWPNSPETPSKRVPHVVVGTAKGAASPEETALLLAETMRQFEGMSSLRVVAEVGRNASQADYIVRAVVGRNGDSLRLTGYVLDGSNGVTLAMIRTERADPNLSFGAIDSLAVVLASFARGAIGRAEEQRLLNSADVPKEAIKWVKLARADRQRADSLRRVGALEAARVAYERADSTYVIATAIAPRWSLPYTHRAMGKYQHAWLDIRRGPTGLPAGIRRLKHAIGLADTALMQNRNDLDALEIRAMASFLLWKVATEDLDNPKAVLARAERDAREVTMKDPGRSQAWNTLGAILIGRGEYAEAYWALQRAYAENSDLRFDAETLARLFHTAYESGDLEGAARWCQITGTRYGNNWPAIHCQMMLALEGENPTESASQADSLLTVARGMRSWSIARGYVEALAAAAHGRAGNAERAEELLTVAMEQMGSKPGLEPYVARALIAIGAPDSARSLLYNYIRQSPGSRLNLLKERHFQAIRSGPAEGGRRPLDRS